MILFSKYTLTWDWKEETQVQIRFRKVKRKFPKNYGGPEAKAGLKLLYIIHWGGGHRGDLTQWGKGSEEERQQEI